MIIYCESRLEAGRRWGWTRRTNGTSMKTTMKSGPYLTRCQRSTVRSFTMFRNPWYVKLCFALVGGRNYVLGIPKNASNRSFTWLSEFTLHFHVTFELGITNMTREPSKTKKFRKVFVYISYFLNFRSIQGFNKHLCSVDSNLCHYRIL